MLLLVTFVACVAAASADVVTSNVYSRSGSGSSFTSSGSEIDGKYFGQWTVGDLTCYIAQDKVNGVPAVVKQCRRGLLGSYHPMTASEEAIIQEEIQKSEQTKAEADNTVKIMNQEMQRRLQGMHNTMSQMMNVMQQQMQAAFGAFG